MATNNTTKPRKRFRKYPHQDLACNIWGSEPWCVKIDVLKATSWFDPKHQDIHISKGCPLLRISVLDLHGNSSIPIAQDAGLHPTPKYCTWWKEDTCRMQRAFQGQRRWRQESEEHDWQLRIWNWGHEGILDCYQNSCSLHVPVNLPTDAFIVRGEHHEYHRLTNCFELEGTSKTIQLQPPCYIF